MRKRLRTLAVAGMTVCLTLPAGVAGAEPRLTSAAAASAAAEADLALIQLPPGTAVAAASPVPFLDAPPEQPAADTLVQRTFWATTHGTVNDVLAYVDAHRPAGFVLSGFDRTTVDGQTSLSHSFGRGYLSDQTVWVTALQAGSTVDLRVDAQLIWYPTRTAAEAVPAAVTSATLDYLGPLPGSIAPLSLTPRPLHAHRVLTGTALRRIAADLNALKTTAPGEHGCGGEDGELGRLRMTISGQHVVFSVDFGGCTGVSVTADGKVQPNLGYANPHLDDDLYAAIGVRFGPLPVTAPQGPPVATPAPSVTLAHSAEQARRSADALLNKQGAVPGWAQPYSMVGTPGRPPYAGLGVAVDRTHWYSVQWTGTDLLGWFQAHAPEGYVVAEPGKPVDGVRRLVLEPKDRTTHPSALLWVSIVPGDAWVTFRLDAQSAWTVRA